MKLDYDAVIAQVAQDDRTVLLDCRTTELWLWETIPGSKNLRLKDIPQRVGRVLPDCSQPVITFADRAGAELAHLAYRVFKELGYTSVFYFSGGVEEWKDRNGSSQLSPNRISERCFRLPSQRFYGEEVGCYLINTNDYLLLVDGPQTLSEGNEDFILSFNKPIRVFLTHGGAGGGTCAILATMYKAEIFLHETDKESEWLTCEPSQLFSEEFEVANGVSVIHTPGHSPGSCCLFDSQDRILFSGCHLRGRDPSNLHNFLEESADGADTSMQLKSVEKIQFLPIETICPFSGAVLSNLDGSVIAEFIRMNAAKF